MAHYLILATLLLPFAEAILLPADQLATGHVDDFLTIKSRGAQLHKSSGVLDMSIVYTSPLQVKNSFCLEMGDRMGSPNGPHIVPIRESASARYFSEYDEAKKTGRLTLKLRKDFIEQNGDFVLGLLFIINDLSPFQTTSFYASGVTLKAILASLKIQGNFVSVPGTLHVLRLPPSVIDHTESKNIQLVLQNVNLPIPGMPNQQINYATANDKMIFVDAIGASGQVKREASHTGDGKLSIVIKAEDIEKGIALMARDAAGFMLLKTSIIRATSFVDVTDSVSLDVGRDALSIPPHMYAPLNMPSAPPPSSTPTTPDGPPMLVASSLPTALVCKLLVSSDHYVLTVRPKFRLRLGNTAVDVGKPLVLRQAASEGIMFTGVYHIDLPAMNLVQNGSYSCEAKYGRSHRIILAQAVGHSLQLKEPPKMELGVTTQAVPGGNLKVQASCSGTGPLPLSAGFVLLPAQGFPQPLLQGLDERVHQLQQETEDSGRSLRATLTLLVPQGQATGAKLQCRMSDSLAATSDLVALS